MTPKETYSHGSSVAPVQTTIVLPLEGGDSPNASLGLATGPAIMGSIAFTIGAFVMLVLSRKADPHESHAIRLFGAFFILFGALFIKVGIGSVLGILSARKRRRDPEPALRDYNWNRRTGTPNQYVNVLPHLAGFALFSALVIPFNTIWTAPWIPFWIGVGILDLIWLAVAWEAIRRIVQKARAGRVTLEWGSFPFYVGQRFDAIFRSSRPIASTGPLQVTLRSVTQRWSRRSQGNSASKDSVVLHSQTIAIPATPGAAVPISFQIPPGAPGTTLSQTEPVFWQIEVKAETVGPDFAAMFLVPIYDLGFQGSPAPVPGVVDAPGSFRANVRMGGAVTRGGAGGRSGPLIGAVVFGAIGLLLLAWAWSFARDAIAFRRGAAVAQGAVIRNDIRYTRASGDTSPSRMYVAIVRYEVDGRAYEIEQAIGSGSPTFAEQEQVEVLYPLDLPSAGQINNFMELYFPIVLLGVMGAMCTGAALVIVLVFVRRGAAPYA